MDFASRLNQIVERHDLNLHPFYEEWRKGALPQATLATYAEEYGQLVALMPEPWSLLGDPAIAQEERDHKLMWDSFARSLGTSVPATANLRQVQSLVATSRELFSARATALGALYAFEVQQPSTAATKLAGLLQHYRQLDPLLYSAYFEVHSRNHHESVALLQLMERLGESEREQASCACEKMCIALWDALSGILDEHCPVA